VFAVFRPKHHGSTPRGTPEILAGIGEGYRKSGFRYTKALISLEHGKIGPRLVLRSNGKSYMRFRLVPKSMTLDDLEGSLCILFQNTCAMVLLFIYFQFHIQSAFSRQMTAGALTALTFRKLKQITIKESLGIGKTCCSMRFPCDNNRFPVLN